MSRCSCRLSSGSRKEVARPDAPGQAAVRRGGREAAGHTHAGAPELQVQAAQAETRQEGTGRPVLAPLGGHRAGQ